MFDDYSGYLVAKQRIADLHAEADVYRLAAAARGRRRPRRRLRIRLGAGLVGRPVVAARSRTAGGSVRGTEVVSPTAAARSRSARPVAPSVPAGQSR